MSKWKGLSFDLRDDVPLDVQQTIASTLFELIVLLKENGKFSNGTLTKLLFWVQSLAVLYTANMSCRATRGQAC